MFFSLAKTLHKFVEKYEDLFCRKLKIPLFFLQIAFLSFIFEFSLVEQQRLKTDRSPT